MNDWLANSVALAGWLSTRQSLGHFGDAVSTAQMTQPTVALTDWGLDKQFKAVSSMPPSGCQACQSITYQLTVLTYPA